MMISSARLCALVLCSVPLGALAQDAGMQRFDCVVEPAQRLQLSSSVTGILDRVLVERGATVTAGQIIAELRSEPEAARLRLAQVQAESDALIKSRQASVRLAETERARTQELRLRKVASVQQEQEAEAKLETAQMDLRMAELQRDLDRINVDVAQADLEARRIRSPIDGIVVERSRGPGEYVFQDRHILTVAQVDPLHVEAWLPQDLFEAASRLDRVSVRLALPRGEIAEARVTIVDPVFDAATGTVGMRAEIPNPAGRIPAGQACELLFSQF